MKIDYSPYTLCNSQANREGALLRIQFKCGGIGYADCHPWPEFGDPPLKEQLNQLQKKHTTRLTRCSLNFGYIDAKARQEGISLLSGAPIPLSHYLIMDLLNTTEEQIEQILALGYSCIKIKVGRNPAIEVDQLLKLFSHYTPTTLKLRLDFNERLSFRNFNAFLKAISKLIPLIDFFEDPFPYEPKIWKQVREDEKISLACDRQAIMARLDQNSYDWLVIKPAVDSYEFFEGVHPNKMIVTSYLDHPFGQLTAAYIAGKIDPQRRNKHGLLSHHVYQQSSFSKLLNQEGPSFSVPNGTGFGFDNELKELEWNALI